MVVDASVLAKLFVAEEGSERTRALLETASEIWTSAHALAELAEVLCRKVALGEVSREQCRLALDVAVRLVSSEPLNGIVGAAAQIAQDLNLSVYDTLYLALAEKRGETLITWDQRLLRGVQGSRFETIAQRP